MLHEFDLRLDAHTTQCWKAIFQELERGDIGNMGAAFNHDATWLIRKQQRPEYGLQYQSAAASGNNRKLIVASLHRLGRKLSSQLPAVASDFSIRNRLCPLSRRSNAGASALVYCAWRDVC